MHAAEDRRPKGQDDERRRGRRVLSEAEVDRLSEGWASVIDGVVELDVKEAHAQLEHALRRPRADALTGSAVTAAIADCQANYVLAIKLAAKARREYELYKDSFDAWLEPLKSAAIVALEEEKTAKAQAKEKTKQITQDMVMDRVRASWGEEYRRKRQQVLDFQAAVHTLEQSVDAWKQRTHALAKLVDMVVAQGDAESVRGRRRDREY